MENQLISYPAMGVETMIVNDRLFIDSEDLINHLSIYYTVLIQNADNIPMAAAAETVRNLALFLLEANDLAIAADEKMFAQGLDNLLEEE
mgnify:CR=1 FL=1